MKQYVVGTTAMVLVVGGFVGTLFGTYELLGVIGIDKADNRIGTMFMITIGGVLVGAVGGEIGKEILKSEWWGKLEGWVGNKRREIGS